MLKRSRISSWRTASRSPVSSSSHLLPIAILPSVRLNILTTIFSNDPRSEIFSYFKSDNRNLSNLAHKVDQSFTHYLSGSDRNKNSIRLHFAARLLALTQFEGDFIGPSINLSWNFLIWHQLIYETLAIKHPGVFGFGYAGPQTIQLAVNQDVQRCFAAALKQDVNEGQRTDDKVSTIYLPILILCRVACSLSSGSAPASSPKWPPNLPTKHNSSKRTITPSSPPL